MHTSLGDIQYIPYQQAGEPKRRAAVIPVEIELNDLSDLDLQVLGHLVEAAEAMNPIFRHQFEPRTFILRRLVQALIQVAQDDDRQQLINYLTILDLQNSPYALLPRKNHLLQISPQRLEALVAKAGGSALTDYPIISDLLVQGTFAPEKANFYPHDLRDDEYEALGVQAGRVNSSVVRDAENRPMVLCNEERYRQAILPALEHLRAARDQAREPSFRLYLDAKIVELETGFEEARRLADYAWVRHSSPIDVVISSALEVYLDEYKNARGSAAGGVYVRNRAAEALLNAIVEQVPALEAQAPWTYKVTEIDPERLPKLKFVDVIAWAGDYVSAPFTTIAQSLPNDEWVSKNIGTVNMVYLNTGKALHQISGDLMAQEFLTSTAYDQVRDLLYESNQLHSALHEIGHSCGRMDPGHSQGQPRDYLEEQYSFLEETRAELFGLWAPHLLVDQGVISEELARASYEGMLLTMLASLKFEPAQAHTMARNAMFHVLDKQGAIQRLPEKDKTCFQIDHAQAAQLVEQLLRQVADIRSTGDKPAAIAFRQDYVYTDPLKEEIEQRTAEFPLGRGLIFPRLKQENGRYLRQLVYPDTFSQQAKFDLTFQEN